MLLKFQWQKEKLFEQPRSGPGFATIYPESTNNVTDMNNNEEKTISTGGNLQNLL